MTDKITIEIDGRSCEAEPGEMLIAVADRMGIPIPRFCYHKKLSIAANCRMCLVEAEQGGRPFPKPVPACATPAADGMKVQTRSPKAIDAQQGTMEFLLINHPLDCPICDQGGECELQDVAMGYGAGVSRFSERKRVVKDEDLGPLIATEMTRCIHCTRCVRFGAEIAGVRELGATGRGETMRIGTFVAHTVSHELSGNIIDLCPVGALTSKPYRFTARAWELSDAESIAPHDSVGSNIRLHLRRGEVMRVHPRDNEAVNETWISDRDRYSYAGLHAADRLTAPLLKERGAWREIGWSDALTLVAERLKAAAPADTGWLLSPSSTLEEMFLAQALARGLGCGNIDSRPRQRDFRGDGADPLFPWLGVPIADLERQGAVLLVGCDIRAEQPLLAHRIRKAALDGAMVALVNPYGVSLTHPATQILSPAGDLVADLAAIAKALRKRGSGSLKDLIAAHEPNQDHSAVAEALKGADEAVLLLGALAAAHPDYSLIKGLAQVIAEGAKCRVGHLLPGANGVGAHLAGALPHVLPGARAAETPGLPVAEQLAFPRKTVVLWGLEPDRDFGNPAKAMEALGQAEFVIAASAFQAPSLEAVADLLLPIGAFAETSGTFVNAEGIWQSFQGAVAPPGEARPGWKVLRVLGNLLDLPGFDYPDGASVRAALAQLCADAKADNTPAGKLEVEPRGIGEGLVRIGDVPIYSVDALVRRSAPLQRTPTMSGVFAAHLHPSVAADLGVREGDRIDARQGGAAVSLAVVIDDQIPPGSVRIPSGVPGSESLGDQIAPIELTPAGGAAQGV